jgi:hypothetical protein
MPLVFAISLRSTSPHTKLQSHELGEREREAEKDEKIEEKNWARAREIERKT